MSTIKLSRKEREKATHREEILQAALCLFSSKGFYNVSMQEIAVKSEFAVGTLYNFFDSKETLFEGLISHFGDKILAEVSEILDGPGSEAQRLTALIRYQPQIQEKYSEIIKLYASMFDCRTTSSKTQTQSRIKEKMDLKIANILKQGIDKGLFRPVDPQITAKAINSTIEALAFEIAGSFDKTKVTEMFKKVEQLFIDGLLTSPAILLEAPDARPSETSYH